MEGDHIKINQWLTPLSWLYGMVIWVRNLLFDTEVLKSRSFSVPVISVGNITVGGAGKTPHVEYLVKLLHNRVKTAVLSRGYKRKTKGFVVADRNTTIMDIGDEPYQMHQKFPDITVAVDKNRCHGIDMLMTNPETSGIGVVLLDDAFQHRYVKPGINILLTDYHRIITDDMLLPAGRLREPVNGKDRADIVIVTKCPADIKPMEYRVLQRNMNLFPYQHLFFTTIRYSPLSPIFIEANPLRQPDFNEKPEYSANTKLPNVLLLTGIASPRQIIEDITPYCDKITHIQFADHHQFTASDAESINFAYKMMPKPCVIVTTEKDAMRILDLKDLSKGVRENIYYLPISIEFLQGDENKFNQIILNYVQKNQRNSDLVARTY
ncbi:MAG: tetraacyldisaccharide 4'-kinase [Prevotella sp.]|nr:tetraacyldisaccharide 4'-kinase [Prevotella sp.]